MTLEALQSFHVEGPQTNLRSLDAMLRHPDLQHNTLFTRFIADNEDAFFGSGVAVEQSAEDQGGEDQGGEEDGGGGEEVEVEVKAPCGATLTELSVGEGDHVRRGQTLAVLTAMKLETPVTAPGGGTVLHVYAKKGVTVKMGDVLFELRVSKAQLACRSPPPSPTANFVQHSVSN